MDLLVLTFFADAVSPAAIGQPEAHSFEGVAFDAGASQAWP
jgi:hypothetical protein